jgi:hypothetical protein
MDRGHTFAGLKEAFNIFPSALNARRRLLNETGELRPRPIPGRPPAIGIPALKAGINAKPDAYLRELAEPCGCPADAVRPALKRHSITYKKTFICRERSEEKRAEYLRRLKRIPRKKKVYADESGIDQDLCRKRGSALCGIPAVDAKSGRAFRRTGTAAALQGRAAAAPRSERVLRDYG